MVAHTVPQNKRDFRVAGIDQSLRHTGVCLNQSGCEPTVMAFKQMKLRGAARLSAMSREILLLVRNFSPDLVVLEGFSIGSINRPYDLGEISGVLKVGLFESELEFITVPPKSMKFFVTGDGSASKEKVMWHVCKKYGVTTDNDNIADAVGLAKFGEVYLTGVSTYRSELEAIGRYNLDKIVDVKPTTLESV